MSSTPQMKSVCSPSSLIPSCLRVQECAPSHPIRYFALTVSFITVSSFSCASLKTSSVSLSAAMLLRKRPSEVAAPSIVAWVCLGSIWPSVRCCRTTSIGYSSGSSAFVSSNASVYGDIPRSTLILLCSSRESRKKLSIRPGKRRLY